MKRLFIFSAFTLFFIHLQAQETVYLNNASEIIKDKNNASEFAVITKEKDNKSYTIDFFSMDSTLVRTSQYVKFGKKPDKQILYGKSSYKFNGSQQDSLVCYYRDNLRAGAATFYYPDGKKHIECSYKDNQLHGLLLQYYPNDSIKRKDIYEKGTAKATTFYSEERKLSNNNPFYIAPAPSDTDMLSIIQELAHEIQLSAKGKISEHKMHIEVTFDSKGKMKKVQVIQSDNPKSIEPFTQAAHKVFQDKIFTPAIMDNQVTQGSIILPINYGIRTTRITVQK